MNVLGVGPLEILVVLTIALLVFGPQDLVALARRMGAWLRKLRRTETWQALTRTSYELQRWQQHLWEETGLADIRLAPRGSTAWHAQPPYRAPYTAPEELPPETETRTAAKQPHHDPAPKI